MTQSIESMIEVLQAYKDGMKIEYHQGFNSDKWWPCGDVPCFDFSTKEYRIAPEPKKKVKLEAWLLSGELRWFNDDDSTSLKFAANPVRVPSEDKEIEI